jgi:hypothetical protein
VRFIAEPLNVDPLGSRAIGASVFPVAFLGRFATRPEPAGELNGRLTELPMCIPPRASANVLGTVNAIASAIVVYFMAISFTCEIGDDRTLTTKCFFRRAKGARYKPASFGGLFMRTAPPALGEDPVSRALRGAPAAVNRHLNQRMPLSPHLC